MGAEEREPIRLDQFLKRWGVVGSGGQAKMIIQEGEVQVNGEIETRRGRKLYPGDTVEFSGQRNTVDSGDLGD